MDLVEDRREGWEGSVDSVDVMEMSDAWIEMKSTSLLFAWTEWTQAQYRSQQEVLLHVGTFDVYDMITVFSICNNRYEQIMPAKNLLILITIKYIV